MSMGGIGASGGLSQSLAMLLAGLTGTRAANDAGTAPADEFGGCTPAPAAQPAANTSLTGSTKASLSDEILKLLMQLQQLNATQSAATAGSTGISTLSASTSIATAGGASDPLKQLIAAMDSDGDGEVSQAEMEGCVQNLGGTTAQADALFAGLNQRGTGNLTATQLASDLQQANASGGVAPHHHHHHHHHHAPSAGQVGNDLLNAMDSDGSGAVDQSEFTNFVTGLGGTAAQAQSDFAALDPNSSGTVNASQFANAVSTLEASPYAGTSGSSPILTLLDAFKQTAAAPSPTVSVTV